MKFEDLGERERQLYRCECPPDRPCARFDCDQFRAYYDVLFAGGTNPEAVEAARKVEGSRPPEMTAPTVHRRPGRLRMAYTFARAMIRHARAGFPRIPPEVRAERRRICNGCFRRDKATDSCTLCGCKTGGGRKHLVEKTALPGEKCPAGYWPAVKAEPVWYAWWRLLRRAEPRA